MIDLSVPELTPELTPEFTPELTPPPAPSSRRPIGVFDSGIGGLTVVRHLLTALPDDSFVYLGDTARVPYGNRSQETVQLYAEQCMNFLLQHHVQAIVVACNTVSAVAMDHLIRQCPVPVIGVIEPAAAEAATLSPNGVIGVIGTRATIASHAYATAIHRHSASARIISQACPLFVPLVEEGWLDTPATTLVAETYLSGFRGEHVDTLVLGCTHYPLLSGVIAKLLPGVHLVDCGACTAMEMAQRLADRPPHPLPPDTQRLQVYVTDSSPLFGELATAFLGMSIGLPNVVAIDHHGSASNEGITT